MKIQIFHNAIAPYRIDFFNTLSNRFKTDICLFYRRFIESNYIDSDFVNSRLSFIPEYREDFRGLNTVSYKNAVRQCIKRNKPDVVITMEYGITTLLAVLYRIMSRKKYRIVSMVDESYDMAVGNSQFTWRHRLARKLLLPFIDDLIVVNDRVRDYYQQHYGKGIFFPIITDDRKASDRQASALEQSNKYIEKHGLIGKKVILYVGRLISLKNIPQLINSFNMGNDPNRVLVIVGDGDDKDSLHRLCKGRKDIIFTGALHGEELYAWYNIAQVFALPSKIEAFGAVVNEALQGGCLCLVSDVAGSCCLIEEGKNGYTLPPLDNEKWVEAITESLKYTEPIQILEKVRRSKMPLSFDIYMDSLVNKLIHD